MRLGIAKNAVTLGLVAALGTCGALAAEAATPDLQWSWKLAPGKTVEIRGVNGAIDAVASTSGKVEITAEKSAVKSDPADVKIEVIEHERGVTICAVYPSPDGEKNGCSTGPEFHSHTRDNDVEVHFMVRMPAGIRLDARTVNGSIRATGLKGPAELQTVNGEVKLETTEHGSASSVNGGIVATIGSTDGADDLEFSTVNGGVSVTLPAKANAEVRASVMNGDISSDFPMSVRKRHGTRRATGTIGSGGPRLDLNTLNGEIRLKSARR